MTQLNSIRLARGLDPYVDYSVPTVNADYTLPSVVKAGQRVRVINGGASSGNYPIISIKASNGSLVRQVYPQTDGEVIALQDNPTDTAHWAGMGVVTSGVIQMASPASFFTGSGGTPSISSSIVSYQRFGEFAKVRWQWVWGTTQSGWVEMYLNLPTGLVIDTTRDIQAGVPQRLAAAYGSISKPGGYGGRIAAGEYDTTTRLLLTLGNTSNNPQTTNLTIDSAITAANLTYSGNAVTGTQESFLLPIVGWTATKG